MNYGYDYYNDKKQDTKSVLYFQSQSFAIFDNNLSH